jgi:hypothetical protein
MAEMLSGMANGDGYGVGSIVKVSFVAFFLNDIKHGFHG